MIRLSSLVLFALLMSAAAPAWGEESTVMLQGDWVPENPHDIDFDRLPKIPSQHAVVSDVRAKHGVNQHNYLTYFDGRYWAMWSDGPEVEDRVGQRVAYATSKDGLMWSEPQYMTPVPPNSGEDSPLYNTRSAEGFRWISRGFWQRDGQLLALCSLDEGAGFFGKSLELRAFRWDEPQQQWIDHALVHKNAINNFPPKKIPTGEWMMSRRTYDYSRHGVEFLTGGVDAIDKWESFPVLGSSQELAAEEPYWWVLPDGRLTALFRDNWQRGYLYRSFSSDNGRTWSRPLQTDFPDARSKFSGVRLADGRYVLVSNPHPKRRDPLALSISDDGVVFTKMGYLVGRRHVDYPHVIEQDGHVLVAFAGGKRTVEVLKIRLEDIDSLPMPNKPLAKPPAFKPTDKDLIIDNHQIDLVTIEGDWQASSRDEDRYGEDYLYLEPTATGSVRFALNPEQAGEYEVFAIWNSRGHRSDQVPFTVSHAKGRKTIEVNQRREGGTWNSLGTFTLKPGESFVEVAADRVGQYIVVDAIAISPR
ncbi:golvesin C-terminal-like domain-containing protein [Blastopirellula retiformator]|uniref:Xanthan lyase n=1 Tax=Blastopirellula retiformator TaxID=2527970 RepID=A0A5C5V7Y8_9BACT|nr:exo-alpha-sialidase [Blastopirellula retiformator]TWT34666.1 Xanthan lyase precursor [Blastopirellula retiformator]